MTDVIGEITKVSPLKPFSLRDELEAEGTGQDGHRGWKRQQRSFVRQSVSGKAGIGAQQAEDPKFRAGIGFCTKTHGLWQK